MEVWQLKNAIVTVPVGLPAQVNLYLASPTVMSRQLSACGINQIEALKNLLLAFLESDYGVKAVFTSFIPTWSEEGTRVEIILSVDGEEHPGSATAADLSHAAFVAFQNACPALK